MLQWIWSRYITKLVNLSLFEDIFPFVICHSNKLLSSLFSKSHLYPLLILMSQRLAHRDWRSGGPRFKSHPRLTSQSWPSYQLNQVGSKPASDSTLKQLTTCGVSNTCTLLYFYFTLLNNFHPISNLHLQNSRKKLLPLAYSPNCLLTLCLLYSNLLTGSFILLKLFFSKFTMTSSLRWNVVRSLHSFSSTCLLLLILFHPNSSSKLIRSFSKLVFILSLSQSVSINDSISAFFTLSCGVPQGYILGPQLFTLHTTPLGLVISKIF